MADPQALPSTGAATPTQTEPEKTGPDVPLDPAEFEKWRARVKQSEKKRTDYVELWKKNIRAMAGTPLTSTPDDDTVIVNEDWPRTKAKVAQLMFQVPELNIRARQEQYKAAAPVYAAGLNFTLTHDMKVQHMMDEVLTDVVNAAGIGVSKIGYVNISEDALVPSFNPDPEQAAMIAAGQLAPPEMVKVAKPVFEEYFWKRISPANFLWPADFTGSDWDEAAWLGFEFERPKKEAIRAYGLPESFGQTTKPKDGLSDDEKDAAKNEEVVRGIEIWYWASRFDSAVLHPKKLRRLVFIDGHDEPVVHEDSPYQKEIDGKLIGVLKNPIRVLTLSYLSDKSVPPSDSQVGRGAVNEISESRSQMIRQRRRSLPLRWYDVNAIDDDDTLERIQNGNVQDFIPVNGPGDRMIGEIARANYPRETWEFMRVVSDDLDKIWSMGPNQVGGQTTDGTTAEEVKTIQGNVDVRLDYERAKVLRWFVEGAELVGALLQMFKTDAAWAEVVGEDGQKRLAQWNRQVIAGDYIFEAKPDSQLRVDVASDRAQKVKLYQMLANDPFVNRTKLVEATLRSHNLDPTTILVQPPPKQPDMPNVSYRFNGQDLLNPVAMAIMAKSGIEITQQEVQAAIALIKQAMMSIATPPGMESAPQGQPGMAGPAGPQQPGSQPAVPHGGPAEQVSPLVKHQMDNKGL